MHYLLGPFLIFLVFCLGTATSLGTARALQDWAMSSFDATAFRSAIEQSRAESFNYVQR
jgi:hypothetical protein